jgi:hypothetical protein
VYPNLLGIELESLADIGTDKISSAGLEPGDVVFRCVDGVGLKEVPLHGTLYAFAGVDSSRDTILATYGDKVVAFRRKQKRGGFTVLGFYPQYIQEGSLPLFESILLENGGITRSVYTEAKGVFAALRKTKAGDFTLLTLLNYTGREISTTVRYDIGRDSVTFPRLTELFLPGKSARCLVCQLETGRTRMAYCTEELVASSGPNVYEVLPVSRGYYANPLMNRQGEIAFTSPAEVYLDDQRLHLDKLGDLWTGCFPLDAERRTLRIE